jgi:hypothetical protein
MAGHVLGSAFSFALVSWSPASMMTRSHFRGWD